MAERRAAREIAVGMIVASSLVFPYVAEAPEGASLNRRADVESEVAADRLPKLVVPDDMVLGESNFAVLKRVFKISPVLEVEAYVFVSARDLGPVRLTFEIAGHQVNLDKQLIDGIRDNFSGWGHTPDRETYLEVKENGKVIYGIIKVHDKWVIVESPDRLVLARGSNALYPSEEDCERAATRVGIARIYYESCLPGREVDIRVFLKNPEEVKGIVGPDFDVWKNAEEYVEEFLK